MPNVTFTIPIYQVKQGGRLLWTTIGLGEHTRSHSGNNAVKLQRKLVEDLRKHIASLEIDELEAFDFHRGMSLEREYLELSIKGAEGKVRVAGKFPIVVGPRWLNDEHKVLIAHHPLRPADWFSIESEAELPERAQMFFRSRWAGMTQFAVEALKTDGKDSLRSISFSVAVKSLADRFAKKPAADPRRVPAGRRVLEQIGTNQTQRAIEGTLPTGMPRSPYRRQLQLLLGGTRKRALMVVGQRGVGKSTVINRWIADLLSEDGYEMHRNFDKIHFVWSISGKRIIAGMQYLGDWEKRCIDLLDDVKVRRAVLWVEDLHLFGRLGRTRESDRNLAEFFRGPVSRGEIVMIGECTPSQLQRLEDDAPSFAALFTRVHVKPTEAPETLQMVIHEARALERTHDCAYHPFTYRSILEIGGSLFPWTAFPGKALDMTRQLAERAATGHGDIEPSDVVRLLSEQTGLPANLLTLDARLDLAGIRAEFERLVMGQSAAIDATCDLIARIRAGMTDPRRPFAVNLFTGPTGTGKTELAKCIAEFLFGDASRLLRLDMSEYSTPDAVARLIGDRWTPEGQLTQRIREQPFSVVLLDEIEKAHHSVLNLLLQLFDEGRLTDAAGNTASFNHTVVIMTSNLGARPTPPIGFGESTAGIMADIARAVREFFPPELFNRIDRVVPFSPLTTSVAEDIATKELALLLGRRGLKDRNIFVYANRAVKERIVAEAFDPRHGARTVKRYLEQAIGSMLADEITRGARASMQVVRIYDSDGEFKLHVEPLTEAEPDDAEYALDTKLHDTALRLLPTLARAGARVAALIDSGAREALSDAIRDHERHPELMYYVDDYFARLRALVEWAQVRLPRDAMVDPELIEAQMFSRQTAYDPGRSGNTRTRRFDVRAMAPRAQKASRDDILARVGEAYFLAGNQAQVADPDRHVAWIELLRMGHGEGGARFAEGTRGLLEWMAAAYAGAAPLEGASVRLADGRIIDVAGDEPVAGLEAALSRGRCVHAVLELSELLVVDAFEAENGCHIWRSFSSEPEIVRVRVLSGHGRAAPRSFIDDHIAGLATFEQALEAGADPLPPNPEQLVPAVRTLAFRPPLRDGEVFAVELEDFLTSYSDTLNVRSIEQALRHVWYLRWSRTK